MWQNVLEHYFRFLILFFDKKNNLLSKNQSGFRPGDSTINQLLSITPEIYNAFESLDETRAVFLDISKAFDKVWHEGLMGLRTIYSKRLRAFFLIEGNVYF